MNPGRFVSLVRKKPSPARCVQKNKKRSAELFFVNERHGLLFKPKGVARLGKGPRTMGLEPPSSPRPRLQYNII